MCCAESGREESLRRLSQSLTSTVLSTSIRLRPKSRITRRRMVSLLIVFASYRCCLLTSYVLDSVGCKRLMLSDVAPCEFRGPRPSSLCEQPLVFPDRDQFHRKCPPALERDVGRRYLRRSQCHRSFARCGRHRLSDIFAWSNSITRYF